MDEVKCKCGGDKFTIKGIAKSVTIGYDLVTSCDACGKEHVQGVYLPNTLTVITANGKEKPVNLTLYRGMIDAQFK